MTVKTVKMSYITMFIISSFILITRNRLLGFFNLGPEARETAMLFLTTYAFFSITAWTLSFVLPYALRAAGDAKYIMIVGIVSMWTVRVSGAYFLCFKLGLGPIGVWLAMGMDFISRGICFTIRYKKGKWQKIKVISD